MKQKISAYTRLMRLDKPIGIWLLFWPCCWSILLASYFLQTNPPYKIILLFFIGSIIMRSAGCIINDIADRNIDKLVERTKHRPLASGEITLKEAFILLFFLCTIALIISYFLGYGIILLSFCWLPLIGIYPFMKRFTWWPQIFLGITFNAGAIFGWVATLSSQSIPPLTFLHPAPLLLYIGCIFWTLGYDTIYAMQDIKDDKNIGVKSSAQRVAAFLPHFIALCYTIFILCLIACGILLKLPSFYYLGMLGTIAHLTWQVIQIKIPTDINYGFIFKSNNTIGIIITLTCLVQFYL